MTFLEEIKAELENVKIFSEKSAASELRAVVMFAAAKHGSGALFGADGFNMAKRVGLLLKKSCGVSLPEKVDESAGGYKFFLPESVLNALFLTASNGGIVEKKDAEGDIECMRAFVRGAFLAAGSASNPEKSYRIEVFSERSAQIEKLCAILSHFDVEIKKTKRKNLFVAYVNKCESAADFLRVAGSCAALFRMFEAKAVKDRRNDVNRVTNCDLANASRAADCAVKQRSAIEKISRTAGLESLNEKLREAALLRTENEFASTEELARLAGVSKSAMYSRLNKIMKTAEEIKEE